MDVEIPLPKLGESIVSAVVVQWFKKEGDFVNVDDPLLEVSTDKVNSEIPSSYAGVLKKILVSENQEVYVGQALAIISIEEKGASKKATASTGEFTETSQEKKGNIEKTGGVKEFYSPAVLNFAKEHDISSEELEKIASLHQGRLSKKDLEKYIQEKNLHKEDRYIPMTAMRKTIAKNMKISFSETPHASLITEIDVTELTKFLAKEKEAFFQKHQVKLSMTSFIVKAITEAVLKYPLLNSSLKEDYTLVVKSSVNVGVAVHIDEGLLVPVLPHCQNKSIAQIAKELSDLVKKAREKKISLEEMQKGSITLSNFGMTGILLGLPIIRFPEVAIVAAGAVEKKVRVIHEEMKIRSVVMITLTFDHRVIDGIYGCEFLKAFQQYLEEKSWKEVL